MATSSLPPALKLTLKLMGDLRTRPAVVLGVVALDGAHDRCVVRLDPLPGDRSVVGHDGLDRVVAQGGKHESKPAAHAVADDPNPVAVTALLHRVDGPRHVLCSLVELQRHHLLASLVRLGDLHPVVEVGRKRDETLGGEPVADVLYVIDQPPPLLDHDDPGAGAALWNGEVALTGRAVARKLDHLAHGRERYSYVPAWF